MFKKLLISVAMISSLSYPALASAPLPQVFKGSWSAVDGPCDDDTKETKECIEVDEKYIIFQGGVSCLVLDWKGFKKERATRTIFVKSRCWMNGDGYFDAQILMTMSYTEEDVPLPRMLMSVLQRTRPQPTHSRPSTDYRMYDEPRIRVYSLDCNPCDAE